MSIFYPNFGPNRDKKYQNKVRRHTDKINHMKNNSNLKLCKQKVQIQSTLNTNFNLQLLFILYYNRARLHI